MVQRFVVSPAGLYSPDNMHRACIMNHIMIVSVVRRKASNVDRLFASWSTTIKEGESWKSHRSNSYLNT